MKKIWQKKTEEKFNSIIEDYTVWLDYILDLELIKYDIIWTKAHMQKAMLSTVWMWLWF